MKRLFFMLLLSVLAVTCFAQVDSTTANLINSSIAFGEGHWSWVGKLVLAIGVVSEVLSVIPSKYIPANGVIDAIIKIVKYIGSKDSIK